MIDMEEDNYSYFKPLKDHLKKTEWDEDIMGTLEQYIWMKEDKDKHCYKHFGDQSYFNVYKDGRTEGKLQDWRDWD